MVPTYHQHITITHATTILRIEYYIIVCGTTVTHNADARSSIPFHFLLDMGHVSV